MGNMASTFPARFPPRSYRNPNKCSLKFQNFPSNFAVNVVRKLEKLNKTELHVTGKVYLSFLMIYNLGTIPYWLKLEFQRQPKIFTFFLGSKQTQSSQDVPVRFAYKGSLRLAGINVLVGVCQCLCICVFYAPISPAFTDE